MSVKNTVEKDIRRGWTILGLGALAWAVIFAIYILVSSFI